MAITRTYTTKKECVGLFMEQEFDRFPSMVVTEQPDFWESWKFEGLLDGEDTDNEDEIDTFGLTHPPMWNTWFIPSDWVQRFAEQNPEKVAECGFTLISNEGSLFALGIDGAGYSFREHHFAPLYDAMGIAWHK